MKDGTVHRTALLARISTGRGKKLHRLHELIFKDSWTVGHATGVERLREIFRPGMLPPRDDCHPFILPPSSLREEDQCGKAVGC